MGILLIGLLPLVLGLHIENKRRDQEASGLRRRDPKPRAIKIGRRRRFLNAEPTQLSTSRYHTQSQCKLLTNLPLELRQLMWLECVGGMVIHLAIRKLRLVHVQCSAPNLEICNELIPAESCLSREPNYPNHFRRQHLLSLLLTCRKM